MQLSLLIGPIFSETVADGEIPNATPSDLALAILDCIYAPTRVLNVSAALVKPSLKRERELT
jgi:hypothetical protein